MRIRSFLIAMVAGVGVTAGAAAAAPTDQPQADQAQADSNDASTDQVGSTSGRGRLGFAAVEISGGLRTFLGAPADRGVLVDQLRPDSPAARAGLRVGDVILEVDGAPARTVRDIVEAIADRKKGDSVAVRVTRGRAPASIQVKLDTDPEPQLERQGRGAWRQLDPGGVPHELQRWFGDPVTRQELEATRKRLERLEQRIEQLERR